MTDVAASLRSAPTPRIEYRPVSADAPLPRDVLGAVAFRDVPLRRSDPRCVRVGLKPLLGADIMEVWHASGPVSIGFDGMIRYAADPDHMLGAIEVDERDFGGVAAAAETAYRSKSSFMATMSHELRTPLNIIIGFSSAMVEHPEIYDGGPLPEVIAADLAEIRRNGQHLLGLINDILDLARVEAGRLELNKVPMPLSPLLDEMLRTAQGLLNDRPVLLQRDYQLLLGIFFVTSTLVVFFNLVTDLIYRLIDPRIAVGGKEATA